MAQSDFLDGGDYGPWWMHRNGYVPSPPLPETDWARMELPSSHASPHHRRRGDLHRPAYSAYAAPSSSATQRPAVTRAASLLLSSPSPSSGRSMRHHSSALPLSLPRASTAPTGRKSKSQIFDIRSHSGSRRSLSHRDTSPRSVYQYRSTPDSRRSKRSSLSESDDDETGVTLSSQDAEHEADNTLMAKATSALRDRLNTGQQSPRREQLYEEDEEDEDDEKDDEDGGGYEEELTMHQHQQELEQEAEQSKIPRRHHSQNRRRPGSGRGSGSGGGGSTGTRGPRLDPVIYEEDAEESGENSGDNRVDYGEDDYYRRAETASRHSRQRSASRHTATTPDFHSVVSRASKLRHMDSIDDPVRPRASPRSNPRRTPKRSYESDLLATPSPDTHASLRRAQTMPASVSHAASSPSIASRSSARGSILGFSPSRFATDKPKLYGCVSCSQDFTPSKLAKLKCGHRMCKPCLKRKFLRSVRDPNSMPPRCCTSTPIPVKHVEMLLDATFKRDWNQLFREHSIAKRVYCPSRCGAWIKPEYIYRRSDGRKIAQCNRCHTKVCCACNGKLHTSRNCPDDDAAYQFLEAAKAQGWQSCYKCKSTDLLEGQNSMLCDCGAQSCMICGGKYKSCDCPVFDCDAADMEESTLVRQTLASSVAPSMRNLHDSRSVRALSTAMSTAMSSAAPQAQSHDHQSFLRRRRMDEYGDDDDLVRYMQALEGLGSNETLDYNYDDNKEDNEEDDDDDDDDDDDSDDNSEDSANHRRRYAHDDIMIHPRRKRNIAGQDDYPQRAATVVPPSAPQPPTARSRTPPQQKMLSMPHTPQQPPLPAPLPQQVYQAPPPFDRTNPGDYYVTGVNRARGVRSSSPDRRLADRFNSDRTGPSPMAAVAPVPPPATVIPPAMPLSMPYSSISPRGPSHAPLAPPPPMTMAPIGLPHAPPPPPPVNMACMPLVAMAPVPMPLQSMGAPVVTAEPPPRHRMDNGNIVYASPEGWTPARRSPDRLGGGGGGVIRHDDTVGAGVGPGVIRRNEPPSSMMAGLTGPGRGMNRVQEWRNYVPFGAPEEVVGA